LRRAVGARTASGSDTVAYILLHPGIFGDDDRHAARQRLHRGIPEAVLVAGMHEHIGFLENGERVARLHGDARIV